MTFELVLTEAVSGPEEGGQSLPRGVVVEDRIVALPRPRINPEGDPNFFVYPAVEQRIAGIVEQPIKAVPVAGFAFCRRRDHDFVLSK